MSSEELKSQVLAAVSVAEKLPLNSAALAEQLKVDHQLVVGAIKSIQTNEGVLSVNQVETSGYALTEEGQSVSEAGSYEARVLALVQELAPADGILLATLQENPKYAAIGEGAAFGFSVCMKNKWIQASKVAKDRPDTLVKVLVAGRPSDETQATLKGIAASPACEGVDEKIIKDFAKRKLIEKRIMKTLDVSKGPAFTTTLVKRDTEITAEMLADGSWRTREFKAFSLEADGAPVPRGTLHPLLKVRTEYREIFLEMGFQEMETDRFVESSFWNFDSLFQPQQHPARDAHDTFFLSTPRESTEFPEEYLERVKRVHSEGGYGSQGYQYDWKREESAKNILRTHTTAVSSRLLYALAQQKEFKPVKYFSIDRVFRNETLDSTHLAEFHQIEGVIADRNLTLGDLIGLLKEFFTRLGIEDLRFKPAFNPYTEPSMEIFSYHKGLDKVVEIGNSGVFRPEMLLPMGLPEDVVVIAWGLSLERPTMIKYGIDNIRDLVGPKVDLHMAKNNPICRL